MAEKYIPKAKDAGLKVNGTVSTIWGCPIEGPTKMEKAVEFAQRWFDIGASDVEHADHDGSASPDRVYRYYSMLMDKIEQAGETNCSFSHHPRLGNGKCISRIAGRHDQL